MILADGALPAPPQLVAILDPRILLGIFVVLALAAIFVAAGMAISNHDALPIVCCLAALVAALNEPIYDILGKIVYANNNPMAYHAFGRSIPLFLVLGYVPWVGLAPYLVFKAMEAGVSRRRLHLAAFILFVSVACVEFFGNSLHLWTYYGQAPMKYLGVAPQAVTYPMVGGFLLYALASTQHGLRRLATGFTISLIILPVGYAATSWPGYFALYSDLPTAVNWLMSAALLSLCAAMAVGATYLASRWRSMFQSGSNDAHSPTPLQGAALGKGISPTTEPSTAGWR
ncbi:hypothetical protein [Mycobacterium arosiense]|uniref:Uncharacterized protein n=1 Tax=Mycobacterium arosiense ATCC BAA-1401 = DSM 45069 TaxID=1265311 RepID=A0A1W9Z5J7_MYCAI|nr:hypothetical protein [Mycobacterium arosiense]ORA07579.1 hypothetical protein BST14_27185 [Mycobacterium arosiense ATCC BAA-1401 = DSM 45069]